jgi:hypothetical protein
VAGKRLNAGERRGFVVDDLKHSIEPHHLQEHAHALRWRVKDAFASAALERGESADQRSDARAVEFGNSGEIDGKMQRSGGNELVDLIAKRLLGIAESQRAYQINDGGGAGFSCDYLHCTLLRPVKLAEKEHRIKCQ